jgi:N6-adenosine-specific RNA methylase IME4
MDIVINSRIKNALPRPSAGALAELETSLLQGYNEALGPVVLWKYEGENIVIDGHNRKELCEKHGIKFPTAFMKFESLDEAVLWVKVHQVGKRNLSEDQTTVEVAEIQELRSKIAMKQQRSDAAKAASVTSTKQKDGERDTASRPLTQPNQQDTKGRTRTAVAKEFVVPERKLKMVAAIKKVPEGKKLLEQVSAGTMSLADANRAVRKKAITEALNSVEAMEAKTLAGVYDVAVIDPPWPMQKIEREVRPNQAAFDYPTMSIEDISGDMGDNLLKHLNKDAHVFLWTTHKFLPDAINLLKGWGLSYVCAFTWHKPGGFQPIGLPQYNCEFALYARKGTPKFVDTKKFNTCFEAPRGKHSEKPEEFYATLRRVTGGRRVDMYNRRKIEGFDGWGKESK